MCLPLYEAKPWDDKTKEVWDFSQGHIPEALQIVLPEQDAGDQLHETRLSIC